MRLDKFYEEVENNNELKGVNIGENRELAVMYKPTGCVTVIPCEAVEKADWQLLEDVVMCKRDPKVLYHLTRVVGYYSRVENWNKSKIGELKDRQKGNYEIS